MSRRFSLLWLHILTILVPYSALWLSLVNIAISARIYWYWIFMLGLFFFETLKLGPCLGNALGNLSEKGLVVSGILCNKNLFIFLFHYLWPYIGCIMICFVRLLSCQIVQKTLFLQFKTLAPVDYWIRSYKYWTG